MTAVISAPAAPPGFTQELDALAVRVKLSAEMLAFLIEKDFLEPFGVASRSADDEKGLPEGVLRPLRLPG